jgi:hypothetical protein
MKKIEICQGVMTIFSLASEHCFSAPLFLKNILT